MGGGGVPVFGEDGRLGFLRGRKMKVLFFKGEEMKKGGNHGSEEVRIIKRDN